MHTQHTMRSLLGFTQGELALLLRVNRSMLVRFESGKGDLPIEAKYLLAELLAHAQSDEAKAQKSKRLAEQQPQKQLILERMIKDIEIQIRRTSQQLEDFERKQQARMQALQLINFLTKRADEKEELPHPALQHIERKANRALHPATLKKQIRLQMQLELYQLQKVLLDSKLRQVYKSLGLIDDTK